MTEEFTKTGREGAAIEQVPNDAPAAPRDAAHDDLLRTASDLALGEDGALALLARADLPADVVEQLAKNRPILQLRKVRLAVACHAHTPRHISLPLIRQLYTFDLMKVALSPVVPSDVKVSADEALLGRLKTVTSGERLTLARRGCGRVAGALLLDAEERIMRTALENPRVTEPSVIQAVLKPEAGPALVQVVSHHEKWSQRRDVRVALLRSEHLSLARALAFAHDVPAVLLAEILRSSRLPEKIKKQVAKDEGKQTAASSK